MSSDKYIGQKFGRLNVISFSHFKNKHLYYVCKCDCGTDIILLLSNVIKGNTKSCGCLKREINIKKNTTHGLSKTKLYKSWKDIVKRCENEKCKSYENYGGRGILICDEWRNNYATFHEYISKLENFGMSDYTLDRINNNGNYEPGNVRWATKIEQNSNTRNNRYIEINGITKTLSQWCRDIGISNKNINKKLKTYGIDYIASRLIIAAEQ